VVYPNWQFIGDRNDKINFPEFDFVDYQMQRIHIKPESLIRSTAIKNKDGSLKYGYIPETKARANDWAYFISLAANGLKFKCANDNYINYRIKQGSMVTSFTKAEESRIFYNYLSMFRRAYGDKIIEPSSLLVDIIDQVDSGLRRANETIEKRDASVKGLHRKMKGLSSQVNQLEEELHQVYSSKSWWITKPLRLLSGLIRKMIKTNRE
ncbi:hypothetical protein B7Z28_00145, partial [Candidatus Saccharibacteria bacterium 32-45-3]